MSKHKAKFHEVENVFIKNNMRFKLGGKELYLN